MLETAPPKEKASFEKPDVDDITAAMSKRHVEEFDDTCRNEYARNRAGTLLRCTSQAPTATHYPPPRTLSAARCTPEEELDVDDDAVQLVQRAAWVWCYCWLLAGGSGQKSWPQPPPLADRRRPQRISPPPSDAQRHRRRSLSLMSTTTQCSWSTCCLRWRSCCCSTAAGPETVLEPLRAVRGQAPTATDIPPPTTQAPWDMMRSLMSTTSAVQLVNVLLEMV